VISSGPYIGLDYFLEEDAGLFFGRDAERKRIIGNLRASRLTLLYAESGVGKSSLLRAGVSARLRQFTATSIGERGSARYVPVVFSAWQGDARDDLIAALEGAVRPLLGEDAQLALPRDTLEGAIESAVEAAKATVLIILDQFEERFLYEDVDDGFDDELAHCINRPDLRANFLLSVREEAYPLIGPRFKARIANVYGNYLHLDFLDARAARDAVVKPVEAFNELRAATEPPFEVETALVDAVLNQVRRGRVTMGDGETPDMRAAGPARVETAYLQLVMKRLWDEETAAGSQRLRLETLRRLGGADTIVHGHLDEVMAKLPDDQREAAATAFRFLVTSSGRKIALSSEELQEFSDADSAALGPALEHLERERILRPIPAPEPRGVARHELYHDVLAPAILDWRRRHREEQTERGLAQARARARRLEVRNHRLAAGVIVLTAISVALALYVWNPVPMQRLELATVDARYSLRGTGAPDPLLMLIAVDDRTLARLHIPGQPGILRRAAYARMLDRLRADRPAAIAIDVFFVTPRGPRGDRALLEAIRATGERLVLAYDSWTVPGDGKPVRPELFVPTSVIRATKARTAFAGLPEDRDDHNRRANYVVEATEGVPMQTFSFAAADVARGGALEVKDLPTADRRAWGGQNEANTWIDFRGPPGTIRRVSALDVLDGRVAPGSFRGKVVVIGKIARNSDDVHETPLAGDDGMAGPEVQANAIDTILRGVPLRDVSRLVDLLAILLLACVPAVATLMASRAVGAALIAAAGVVFLAAVQLAFNAGWIIAVVVPLAALLASAVCVGAVLATRMVRRRRRARSRSEPGRGRHPGALRGVACT
jgi:CHASE2 domain-containing sensor protein